MATLSRRTRLLAVIIVALFGWGAFSLTPYWVDWLLPSAMPPVIDENEWGDRILFIAPHPDDESLGAGGLIQRVLARGKKVTVVFMTCGDGYRRAAEYAFKTSSPSAADYLRLGWLRRKEALSATSYLGIHPRDVIFLGFPDGGLAAMWNKHWDNDNPVRGLNGAIRAPYPFAFQAERPYSGTAVVAKLAAILKQYEPTDILCPDSFDQHPDHWATAAFVKYTLVQMNVKPREWTYLVHRGDFPVPWAYTPWRALVPPRALTRTGVRWESFLLHPEEKARKLQAIHRHASQMRVIGPFLDSFVRRNELLGRFEDPVLPISRDFDPQRSPT
ncbi:MAG: PIG-L family deacetylase, partial [Alicyclobacillaceae bacterium]|nr:PIG-L family deacetylase [Alicyclobacillaceae bacterium]